MVSCELISSEVSSESILDEISYDDHFRLKSKEPYDDPENFPSNKGSTVTRPGKTMAAVSTDSKSDCSFLVPRRARFKVSEI